MTDEPVTFSMDYKLHEGSPGWRHILREMRAPHVLLVSKNVAMNIERGYSTLLGPERAGKTTLCMNMNAMIMDLQSKEPMVEDGVVSVRKGDHDESC